MNKKTFIILVVILVLAYAASAGRGFFHEDDDSEITKKNIQEKMAEGEFPPAWLDGMGNLVAKQIGADDILAVQFEKPEEGTYKSDEGLIIFFTKGAKCRLTFKPGSFFSKTRSLVLTLESERAAVDVTAPTKNEEGKRVEETLSLPTDKDKLTLTCTVGSEVEDSRPLVTKDQVTIVCTGLVDDPQLRYGENKSEICEVRIHEPPSEP